MASITLRDALLRGKRRPRRFGAGSPTTYRGDGYEFVELRAYVPGDDVRRIDWAATARAGDLQTRVVLEDVALTLAALIDDSASMRVGRKRPLLDAAGEAVELWYGSARGGDRVLRVGPECVVRPGAPIDVRFDLERTLLTARAVLPRGAALLAISDWFDLSERHHDLLASLASRCDCTALVARDPWYDGLGLSGFVRIRGAESGHARLWIGARERRAFAAAVRAREAELHSTFASLGWRTGMLEEHDGVAGLLDAFGLNFI
ncbi:MAG: DUF58 domain-containing protein [Candidatus Eremiobacteraeota bacterium]|nr:DUF58 domain-containing protein [Candidatus Eremiobacteraeota bacterium]